MEIGKRTKSHKRWEPIYIGTNDEPVFDERLSYEGRADKMTQVSICHFYIMLHFHFVSWE